MPPVADDPAAESVEIWLTARRAVPLQAGRVDEEALAVSARRRATVAGVKTDGLPASVGRVGRGYAQAPVVCLLAKTLASIKVK